MASYRMVSLSTSNSIFAFHCICYHVLPNFWTIHVFKNQFFILVINSTSFFAIMWYSFQIIISHSLDVFSTFCVVKVRNFFHKWNQLILWSGINLFDPKTIFFSLDREFHLHITNLDSHNLLLSSRSAVQKWNLALEFACTQYAFHGQLFEWQKKSYMEI